MILNNTILGNGWKEKFNDRIEIVFKLFPDISVNSVERYEGMLRIKLFAIDKEVQFILDCVSYKIERESAKTCESCGKAGRRITDRTFLSETKCLCWKCYAIEIDSMELHSKE
jgi:hypothetical protein